MKRNYKDQIYMFDGDQDSVYLSNVVTDPDIQVGEHTYYNDFWKDPRDFQKNNVLYHHPEVYHDKIVIGKYCSIACGATFVCAGGFHSCWTNSIAVSVTSRIKCVGTASCFWRERSLNSGSRSVT